MSMKLQQTGRKQLLLCCFIGIVLQVTAWTVSSPIRSSGTTGWRLNRSRCTIMNERKAGVASPSELREFVENAGEKLVVIDVRNPDAEVEPGDQKSLAVAALPSYGYRKSAMHIVWDRTTNSMKIPDLPKDTPIITHCGGGGRGQLAKDFLIEHGFENVMNGGGPKETECWMEYGDK